VIDTKPLGHEQLVASFLVTGSRGAALIDPGFPASAETVADGVRACGVDPEGLDYILLTHTHIDHAGAVGRLAQIAQNAKIVAHKRGAFYLKNSAKISGGGRMVFGPELSDRLGETADVPGARIRPVSDGDSVDLGDKRLAVLYTPGHSGDHVSYFEEATGTLFPGDTACLHYPQLGHALIPAGSPPIYRTDNVLEELQRLAALDVKCLLTPHFGGAHSASPADFLARNVESVKTSRSRIEEMFTQGLEFPQVVEKLRADIIRRAGESGRAQSDIPDFLADVWLRIMLKTGLMGYMADILEYAREFRPFRGPVGLGN
jgi:glyoxylase-like metal-dependent hydrolase (beta-lactamase superfamily II)